MLYYESGWRFSSLFTRAAKTSARPKLRVVPPPAPEEREPEPVGAPVQAAPHSAEAADEQLEAKLDAVLGESVQIRSGKPHARRASDSFSGQRVVQEAPEMTSRVSRFMLQCGGLLVFNDTRRTWTPMRRRK